MSSFPFTALVLLVCFQAPSFASAQDVAATGTVRGTVVAAGGTPLEKIAVRIVDTGQVATTDAEGRFEIAAVPAGTHEILVSAVDLIRVRRSITVTAGSTLDLRIPLSEGTGAFNENVGVAAEAISASETTVPAQEVLGPRDLQQLRGLLTNDPFRAIQALPGVAAGDDLRSEFVVRGLFANHMAFTFEGIATPLIVHTVHGLPDGGSVAMVNGDILDGISLSHGSYPQQFGNRIGAELDFRLREGARDEVRGHVGVSMTDASAVAEGPIGRRQRGSWLVSFRQSYLERLLRTLYPDDNFGFGFSDIQTKVVYDVSDRHQLQVAATVGHSLFQQPPSTIDADDIRDAKNALAIGVVTWRFATSARSVLTQRLGFAANTFDNSYGSDVAVSRGDTTDVLYRADWTHTIATRFTLQSGGEIRHGSASEFTQAAVVNAGQVVEIFEDFNGSGVASSAYVMGTVKAAGATVTPGARVDHWSANGHTTMSPWVQANRSLNSSLMIRGGGGIYRQEPGFAELDGRRRDPTLRAERAYHLDAGIEGRLSSSMSWQATIFNREDRDLIRLPGEIRLVNGTPALPPPQSPYRNALDGHARGFEVLIKRRSPNGLSGWLSYDFAVNRYRDHTTGETFYGDYDQRHTLNAYASYRRSERMSFSARFRYGSNFPAAGYWTVRNDQIFLGIAKNEVRTPAYSRLDLRANRTFDWTSRRLTLFLEVVNVYDRENVRAVPPAIFRVGREFRVLGLFDSMFPIIPSVGVLIDF